MCEFFLDLEYEDLCPWPNRRRQNDIYKQLFQGRILNNTRTDRLIRSLREVLSCFISGSTK